MTVLVAVMAIVALIMGSAAFIASRCPVVRIIAKLFSAQAERHHLARLRG